MLRKISGKYMNFDKIQTIEFRIEGISMLLIFNFFPSVLHQKLPCKNPVVKSNCYYRKFVCFMSLYVSHL